jgi:hypothetical protein
MRYLKLVFSIVRPAVVWHWQRYFGAMAPRDVLLAAETQRSAQALSKARL